MSGAQGGAEDRAGVWVAVDIGGTFTDLVAFEAGSGRVRAAKSLSTPPEFERGVEEALAAAVDPEPVRAFLHGTTVVINALIERKGAPTALVTTRGFRDVLEIGRANRPDLYNMRYAKPRPFVRRRHRLEVGGRVTSRGLVTEPLRPEELREVARFLRDEGIRSVAVSFLNAYANPALEEEAARILAAELPGVSVTCATAISRRWREYERTNTAVLNAFVQPVASAYLGRLGALLDRRGVPRNRRWLMQSGGGLTDFADALPFAIHLVESGPAAGVVGAAALARAAGLRQVVALDVGGTTAKASLVEDGRVRVLSDYAIERRRDFAGYPLEVPAVDLVEVGAGGGSIAWIDPAGQVRVGPRSAGADPGPAAYGRGGGDATVTDADLVTGRIGASRPFGGGLRLSVGAAREAVTRLGARLGLGPEATARGIARLAEAHMAHAIEMVSLARGRDPRDFWLVAYGGGGPVHAAALARELRLKGVVIPPLPGVFSALGMLAADLRRTFTRTLPGPAADGASAGRVRGEVPNWREAVREMDELARRWLAAQGVAASRAEIEHGVEMRYRGQEHTVRVPLRTTDLLGLELDEAALTEAVRDFHRLHEELYAFRLDQAVEVVDLVVTAVGRLGDPARLFAAEPAAGGRPAPSDVREVDWDGWGLRATPVFERAGLPPGWQAKGPCLIEEPGTTTAVWPEERVSVDELGLIRIEEEG